MEESEDKLLGLVYDKLSAFISFWYFSTNSSLEDFEELEKDIEDGNFVMWKFSSIEKYLEILFAGIPKVSVSGYKYYVKHLTSLDQVDIDDVEAYYLKQAKDRGLQNQTDILPDLYTDGTWSPKEESQIERLNNFLEELSRNKKQLVLKSAIDKQNKSIDETIAKIKDLNSKRAQAMGANVEDYASKRSNDHYIIKSFFKDEDLKKPPFSQ